MHDSYLKCRREEEVKHTTHHKNTLPFGRHLSVIEEAKPQEVRKMKGELALRWSSSL